MSIAFCEFQALAIGFQIACMKTVSETRRDRLEMLVKKHGSLAELNEKLGWARTDPKLTQIRNANARAGREKPYQMGDAMAREIEDKLKIERGWMDTPPSYNEIHSREDPRAKAMLLLEQMSPEQATVAHGSLLRLLNQKKNRATVADAAQTATVIPFEPRRRGEKK